MESYVDSINTAIETLNTKLLTKNFISQSSNKERKRKKRKLSESVSVENCKSNVIILQPSSCAAADLLCSASPQDSGGMPNSSIYNPELVQIFTRGILSPWEEDVFNQILKDIYMEKNIEESLLIKNHALLHSLWQKLHTGHWSEVPLELRAAFSWGSIMLVDLLLKQILQTIGNYSEPSKVIQNELLKVILACDRGLLMGKPLEGNPLHDVATLFNKIIVESSVEFDLSEDEIPPSQLLDDYKPLEASPFADIIVIEALPLPSLQEFLLNYMEKQLPLKILGLVDSWPARQKWNFSYLCKVAGTRTVPVEVGLRYSDSDWSQVLMTINQYLTTCLRSNGEKEKRAYLAQHQLFDQIPELLSDVIIPDYCHMGEKEPVMNAWVGPEGTVTPLHHDPDHNILVQVYGYKIVMIFPESDSEYLYPFDNDLLSNTSRVNLEEDTKRTDLFEMWPLLKHLKGHYVLLRPGDALYIPPKWWHYVRSLSNSISVSFWWR